MCKMNLENLIIPESQDATNDHRGVSKGHTGGKLKSLLSYKDTRSSFLYKTQGNRKDITHQIRWILFGF